MTRRQAQPGPSTPATVLRVAGSVLGPATLLTALMYYFGLLHAFWFFGTFGVDYTVFGLTTQDYLVRSADGLFVPLTAVAGMGLVVLWGYRLLAPRITPARRRAAAPAVAAGAALLGTALLAVAVTGLLAPHALLRYLALPGIALAVGVVLLLLASRTLRWWRDQRDRRAGGRRSPEPPALLAAEWAAVFLLVSVGLFWAAGDWSAAVGTRRGNQVVQSLPDWPEAALYSSTRLNLASAGARETRCQGEGEDTVFRYDEMHLIVQAGGQYLFLPTRWPDHGQAIVVPKTDDLRLVFRFPGARTTDSC
ncbi:hypothetical protein [Asanoa siamensis]|uniref:Uncharacterized protein n=1 Tax=Asanoa siamensis TaxID=926357 RepID=A0ABQ4CPX2_9ACTN|nr:hypothetical protein [Asanoa siamensis]GIF73043.1 hypothetical protein Asi02nite_25610 [Asanoa siamensis]